MPRLKLSIIAQQDLDRLTGFLLNAHAISQASEVIDLLIEAFEQLCELPGLGQPYHAIKTDMPPNISEQKVRYGKSGYQFLYHYDEQKNEIVILTIKHYRENSYQQITW